MRRLSRRTAAGPRQLCRGPVVCVREDKRNMYRTESIKDLVEENRRVVAFSETDDRVNFASPLG